MMFLILMNRKPIDYSIAFKKLYKSSNQKLMVIDATCVKFILLLLMSRLNNIGSKRRLTFCLKTDVHG